jgi:hypothetical protein
LAQPALPEEIDPLLVQLGQIDLGVHVLQRGVELDQVLVGLVEDPTAGCASMPTRWKGRF